MLLALCPGAGVLGVAGVFWAGGEAGEDGDVGPEPGICPGAAWPFRLRLRLRPGLLGLFSGPAVTLLLLVVRCCWCWWCELIPAASYRGPQLSPSALGDWGCRLGSLGK